MISMLSVEKGGKIEAFVKSCILWRCQPLQFPDLRIIKGQTEGNVLQCRTNVASRGRGGGSSGVVVFRGRGDVSSQESQGSLDVISVCTRLCQHAG